MVSNVTATGADVAVHELASVTSTVKFPDAATVIDCVVAPLLQLYELALPAARSTLPPWQKLVGPLGVIVVDGLFTVIVTELVERQPYLSVAVTSYVVVTVGVTAGLADVDVKPAGRDVQL